MSKAQFATLRTFFVIIILVITKGSLVEEIMLSLGLIVAWELTHWFMIWIYKND